MNPTDLPPLLHRLATAGLTLRRVDCDRIEVAGDGLTDELRQQIREAKPLLLQTMPQPRQPLRSPRVANVKDLPSDWRTDPRFVYIGRATPGSACRPLPLRTRFASTKTATASRPSPSFANTSPADLTCRPRLELSSAARCLSVTAAPRVVTATSWRDSSKPAHTVDRPTWPAGRNTAGASPARPSSDLLSLS